MRSLVVVVGLLVLGTDVSAHLERREDSPARPGPVPALNRVNPRSLVVCKASSKPTRAEHQDIHLRLKTATGPALAQAQAEEAAWHRNTRLFRRCRYEHIQEAVDAAGDDTDIFVLPGVYREEPSRAAPETSSGDNPDGSYSYAYHVAHPHDANLIAILGKKNLTIEGTGIRPEDVLVDVGFAKDVGIRCDQCTGFIIRNLWQRDANEHGIYVLYSDGYIFDRTRGSYNREYSLFSYASDNGLYVDCDAEGGGDSGLYIGASPDTHMLNRFSAEVRNCKMHHNALGFSGTQGNSVWMHDNDFYDNAIGISYDTENDHQNFPQRFSVIENNLIHDNNFDVYAPTSDVPVSGPGYDFFRYPVGTAMWIVGGEDNVIQNNIVWNNIRFGFIVAGNPLEMPLPAQVHRNSFKGNKMGVDPLGSPAPNHTAFPPGGDYAPGGSDFFWDESGNDNCWGPHDPGSGPITTDPPNSGHPGPIPGPCPAPNVGSVGPAPSKALALLNCTMDDSTPPHTMDLAYPCPWGQTNDAPYLNGDEQECGNGWIDLGEDCDQSYSPAGAFLPPETCDSLGHGPGTLACTTTPRACTWDTSGCTADVCREYGRSVVILKNALTPPGDDRVIFIARNVPGGTFNPLTEALSLVIRDDEGLVLQATIPAGSAGWTSSARRLVYSDPSGAHDGIVSVTLRAAPSFASSFHAKAKVRGTVAAAAGTRTGTAVFRIGDDCWADTTPCTGRGSSVKCRGRAQP